MWVPFWLCGACVCLFGLSARVCAFLVGGRVCVPFGLAGVAGGPFWHGGKGACVCLFGLLARVCAFLACWRVCVPMWFVGTACVCLPDLLDQLVGLFGTEGRARVIAFLAC